METVLALDPSLTAFGASVFNNGNFSLGKCWRTDPYPGLKGKSDILRIQDLSTKLSDLIDYAGVTRAVFEDPVGSKSSRAMQSLSYVKGLVVAVLTCKGIPFEPITAREVKKILTSNPSAEKSEIYDIITSQFPTVKLLIEPWNKIDKLAVSDACAVYLAAEKKSGRQ